MRLRPFMGHGKFLLLLSLLGLSCYGQTGLILASPANCLIPVGQALCTTTVVWQFSGTPEVGIVVSQNGGPEVPMALETSNNGAIPAPWIALGSSYIFSLYDFSGGVKGAFLSVAGTVIGAPTIGTLAFGNQTRPSITPNLVANDTYAINVSGASANLPVQVEWTSQSGQIIPIYLGTTSTAGTLVPSVSGTATSTGVWQARWFINGQQVNSNIIEIANLPTIAFSDRGPFLTIPCPVPFQYGFAISGLD